MKKLMKKRKICRFCMLALMVGSVSIVLIVFQIVRAGRRGGSSRKQAQCTPGPFARPQLRNREESKLEAEDTTRARFFHAMQNRNSICSLVGSACRNLPFLAVLYYVIDDIYKL